MHRDCSEAGRFIVRTVVLPDAHTLYEGLSAQAQHSTSMHTSHPDISGFRMSSYASHKLWICTRVSSSLMSPMTFESFFKSSYKVKKWSIEKDKQQLPSNHQSVGTFINAATWDFKTLHLHLFDIWDYWATLETWNDHDRVLLPLLYVGGTLGLHDLLCLHPTTDWKLP